MPGFVCKTCAFGPCQVSWRHNTASIIPCLVSGRRDTCNWQKVAWVFPCECKCLEAHDGVLTAEEHATLYPKHTKDWRTQ